MNYTVYGIRHHGPGSAKNLIHALKARQPDVLLVEGPEDGNSALKYMADEEMKPPVALLMYNPKQVSQAAYFPFALFSPEWQAIAYALRQGIEVRLIDLPMSVQFAEQEKEGLSLALSDPETAEIAVDPLKKMAELAGFADVERWWEYTFEQWDSSEEIFQAILELMSALREEVKGGDKRETLLREAFMRKQIRKAQKEGFQNIAVVCGAWHAPVLHDLQQFPQKHDNQMLRGLKKVKTASAWIPWTYELLARKSGYGAGVHSPAWYHLLHGDRKDVSIRWMVKAARLFRKEDLNTSAAHALEGARLADALAAMRGRPVPGLDELREAVLAVMCEGRPERLELIDKKLSIGERSGKVSPGAPAVPLQKDLEASVRSARLRKEFESAGQVEKKLDLRTPTSLAASILIRRLRLLDIPWGYLKKASSNQLGRFTETWKLKWNPAFALRIIEAGALGNTIEKAANNRVSHVLLNTDDLRKLTELVEDCLYADLPEALDALVRRMGELVAVTQDIWNLAEALPPLVEAFRYGSTRKIDMDGLMEVLKGMLPRIFVGLPPASVQVNEEVSSSYFDKILELNHSIQILRWPDAGEGWMETLERIEAFPQSPPVLQGLAARLLFDQGKITEKEVFRKMSFALSGADLRASEGAFWLEGFLSRSALLIIHSPALWNLLNQWVEELEKENFQKILPILRRIFSTFPPPERARLLDLAKKGVDRQSVEATEDINPEWAKKILPLIKVLLKEK